MSDTFHPGGLSEKDEPYAVDPGNALRKKMGSNVALSRIFTPEKIQACQAIVETAQSDLMEEIHKDLAGMEQAYALAAADPARAEPHMRQIARLAFTIKGRMENVGLTFGFDVAKSLYEYVRSLRDYTPAGITVVHKHIEVLHTLLKDKVKGDGGAMGKEMLAGLNALIKKTKKR